MQVQKIELTPFFFASRYDGMKSLKFMLEPKTIVRTRSEKVRMSLKVAYFAIEFKNLLIFDGVDRAQSSGDMNQNIPYKPETPISD